MPNPPPNLSEGEFRTALARLRDVVGSEWVFDSDADVALYRDAYSPLWSEAEERYASAAVAPISVEQIQSIVGIANDYQLPLYPISTGRNLTYGGSAPVYSGSVVVDLKRMNRILDVNERDKTCLVEPGVSYFDMYRYLRDNDIRLWIDTADPGWGVWSVTRWIVAAAIPAVTIAITSTRTAAWKSCSAMATSCAPAWGQARMPKPGSCSSTGWARGSTASFRNPISAS
jgi:hypothetical protein